ncbi:DUF2971 domain-containing protein [Vibrio harveyi]|nr:DUF2971 domain-containing protein [Vibrio harveyi]
MIYHYSDANALRSIIENKELWLTGHEYMNDVQEFDDGFNLLKDKIRDYFVSAGIDSSAQAVIEHIISRLESTLAFSCSFSNEADLLSQWRSYCPEDGGFSIGFDQDVLRASVVNPGAPKNIRKFEDCIYEPEEKLRQALLHAEHCTNGLLQQIGNGRESSTYYTTFLSFLTYCLRCKNEHFREESEVRLITYAHNAMQLIQVQDVSGMAPQSIFSEEEISFRTNKNIFVPYIKQKFDVSAVKEIYIGPCKNFDTVLKGLTLFLRSQGLHEQIEVKQSEIPFRRW